MKKLFNVSLSTLFILLLFVSCSKDDTQNSSQDLIIGVWKPIKYVIVSFNGTEDVYDLNACEQKSRYTFTKDGIVKFEDFFNDNGICTSQTNFIHLEGYWERISEGKYKFTDKYYYTDTKTTETEISLPDKISFPNSNTMHIRLNNDEQYHYSYSVNIRV